MLLQKIEGEQRIAVEQIGNLTNWTLSAAVIPVADADPASGVTPNGIAQLLYAVSALQRLPQFNDKTVFFEIGHAPSTDHGRINAARDTGTQLRVLLSADTRFHAVEEMREVVDLADLAAENQRLSGISLAQQSADELDRLIRTLLLQEHIVRPSPLAHLKRYDRHHVILVTPPEKMSFWLRGYSATLGSGKPNEFCQPAVCILQQGFLRVDYKGSTFRGPIKI